MRITPLAGVSTLIASTTVKAVAPADAATGVYSSLRTAPDPLSRATRTRSPESRFPTVMIANVGGVCVVPSWAMSWYFVASAERTPERNQP